MNCRAELERNGKPRKVIGRETGRVGASRRAGEGSSVVGGVAGAGAVGRSRTGGEKDPDAR